MTIELKLLVWTVALAFAQMLIAVVGAAQEVGIEELAGNREYTPKLTGWAERARKGHLNILENLALFAPLVLVAQIAGRTNETTALGAEIFFFARLLYVFVFAAGVPYLRTLVWTVSVIGLILIFSQLL
ncbi:MAPEG family protein [Methylocapsa polymorpha]|uniref:MAPEG family protein n=1 Tax=Methylocapsa polymorpha TaxID=3080828 RepID=A0ABZ0HSL9_9HYPH|nr:MAPEG family protein [Methylocapsa sp. RX1]